MSVVLDRPFVPTRLPQGDVPVDFRLRGRVEPDLRVHVDVPQAAPVRVRKKARASILQVAAAKAGLFVAIFALTYVASALSGHVLMEKSRAQSNEATSRAAAAVQADRDVQKRIDYLTSSRTIEDWAFAHSFRPTYVLGQTSKVDSRVAPNQ